MVQSPRVGPGFSPGVGRVGRGLPGDREGSNGLGEASLVCASSTVEKRESSRRGSPGADKRREPAMASLELRQS